MRTRILPIAGVLSALLSCAVFFFYAAGGELSGEVVVEPVSDWGFQTSRFVDLEVHPSDPYSVKLNYVVMNGSLYIDPAEGRRWLDYLREDPRVRVRFDDKIYPLKAILVGKPGELEGFDADRFIYRLDPRD
jgi:hypothetical protein